jgi:uncharacterized repeat protein (TIGR01451 family)
LRRAGAAAATAALVSSLLLTAGRASAGTAPVGGVTPTVTTAVASGVSFPVSELPRSIRPPDLPVPGLEKTEGSLVHPTGDGSFRGPDAALQPKASGSGIPPTSQNFEGVDIGESSSDGVFTGAPPDTNGDVGPNHYVQMVNSVFAVYSKTGTRISGPTPISGLWEKAPNAAQFNCTAQSRGDPVVQYDPMADRWMITQFNFPGVVTAAPPFDECIAISQTADPTGAYYLYDFRYSNTIFNDYPHLGVWPDAYYMSVNQFDGVDSSFQGAGACAFERTKMLIGDPSARQVCFDERGFDPKNSKGEFVYGGQLPSDLDGTGVGANFATPPSAGEPNFFMQFLDSTTAGQDKLLEFKFHVDWANPTNSTFGEAGNKPITIPVADFSSNLCDYNNTSNPNPRACLPQKDSADGLDAIPDRLMYRLAYRRFADHESLVLNHTVDVGDKTAHAGVRWYEIRDPNGAPVVRQQSTYAPDAESRWMGSVAMDQNGDIALGYSLTSNTRNPAIAYTARRPTDPLGQMTLGEAVMYQGLGAQVGTNNRWGDYSSMSVDPNGCTFWYTQEHYLGTGTFNWGTRIGAFTLPSCGDPVLTMNASSLLVPTRTDVTYNIAVTTGQRAVQGASVRDVLPSNVMLLSVSSSRGSCSGTTTIVCNLGNLPAGDIETITLTVHTTTVGNVTNTATLSTTSVDSNLANNVGTTVTQVYDPCTAPGAIIATDPTGDQTGTTQGDLQSVAIAEPYFGPGVSKLVFTIKVQNLTQPPLPNSYWYAHFSYGGVAYFVDMETASDPTFAPTFHYGRFDVDPTSGLNTQAVLGNADSGSFAPDGTISITLANSRLNQDANPAPPDVGTPPAAGAVISGIHGETRIKVGVLLALADTTSGGGYTLSGNQFCAPNTAPTAALKATPTTGTAPLTVMFDASASSDPDPGDSVASYTFYFGDGTPPVTQHGPAVSHTYANVGTYHAALTVMDTHGKPSSNVASADIRVTAPSADLSVDKTGPAKAKYGQSITYTITVHNGGPSAASGVTVTDVLPTNTRDVSISTSQGSCSQNATCNLGTIANGGNVVVTVTVKAPTRGNFTDTAKVSASSPSDPVSSNNSKSLTTKVT